ncbi:MAG: ABC transporter permease [Candidatus Omnitrophota bacterium]
MKREFFLAWRYLFRGQKRHISFIGIVSCLGIIIGVCALIVAFSIVNGVDGGLLERIMQFQYHITVENPNTDKLSIARDKIKRLKDVESASLVLHTQVFAKLGEIIVPLFVKGMDLKDDHEKKLFYRYVTEEKSQNGFFIGEGLRNRFAIDSTLEFYPLKKKLRLKQEEIRGFFRVGLYDIDTGFIITDLERAKELSSNAVTFLGVRIKDPFKAHDVKKVIEKNVEPGLLVNTWIESNDALFATLKLEKAALFIILSLIVIVASFNIFATLTLKVVEKTKDIGILKALGFRPSHIISIFTFQGVILGVLGVLLGSSLGVAVCVLLKRYPFIRVPVDIFGVEYLPIKLYHGDLILIALSGFIVAFVSSLLPAIRASRFSVCDALRYE